MPEPQPKTCVITGATSGIGLEVALRLAEAGWRLALVGRDPVRGTEAAAAIRSLAPKAEVDIYYADLSSLPEVRRLGASLLAALPRIDVLINNAGAFFLGRQLTDDRLERTFALNHMAYFMLTEILRERLVASSPARIVNVASDAHRGAVLDFDNLQGELRYGAWDAYRRSKLCNILHARELARRLRGTGVTANSLHPGFVASRFGDNASGPVRLLWSLGKRLFAISQEEGAKTPLYLAASPEVEGVSGAYFEFCKPATPSAAGEDDATALRLWQASERLAGLV